MLRGPLPPISNRQSWDDVIEIIDEDGTSVDLTDVTAQIKVLNTDNWRWFCDYTTSVLNWANCDESLLATTENGKITIDNDGAIQFTFSLADISTLSPGQYLFAAQITRDSRTIMLGIFDLPVIDGVFV